MTEKKTKKVTVKKKDTSAIGNRSMCAASMSSAAKKGNAVSIGDAIGKAKYIPVLKNLPMQAVMGSNGIPVGKCLMIRGPKGSYKSAFAMGFYGNYTLAAGGFCHIIDTEDKHSTVHTRDILRDKSWVEYVTFETETVLEDAWLATHKMVKRFKEMIDETNIQTPCLIIYDSLTQPRPRSAMKDTNDSGESSRTVAWESGRINRNNLSTLIDSLEGYPISVLFIVQEQESSEGSSPFATVEQKNKTLGGSSKDYACCHDIRITKQVTKQVTGSKETLFNLKVTKNSYFAETPYPIELKYVMTEAVDGNGDTLLDDLNNPIKLNYYDWDYSLTQLLFNKKVPVMHWVLKMKMCGCVH